MKEKNETKYSKEQIINSKRFASYKKDVLIAILKSDCQYGIDEAENLIKSFLEREVV